MENIKKYLAIMFLSKRARSFYWRTLMMSIAGLTVLISEELSSVEITTTTTVILGLIFGEMSKAISNSINSMDEEGLL